MSAPAAQPQSACLAESVRADFPALAQRINGHPLVYFDNAATTQKPRAVIDALCHHYEHNNANVHRGVHTLGNRATTAYEGARDRVATFLNARSREEIIFTRGTTESLNLVAATWGAAHLRAGDVIVLTQMEHHSNLVPWQMLARRTGAALRFLPVHGDEGLLDLSGLDAALRGARLLAFTHISNALGTINPVAELCAHARAAGVVSVVDAAQSAGHMPLDVRALDCDFLAFSGHKTCGPTGIGALYARRELLEAMPPYQGGGEMISRVTFEGAEYNEPPHKFEAGTPPIVQAIGLGAALDYINSIGKTRIRAHEAALVKYAHDKLGAINSLRIIGNAKDKGPIVSFEMKGAHAHDIATVIDRSGVAVRAGTHCTMPLLARFGVTATCRASFGMYNTRNEIDTLAAALVKAQQFFS